MEIELEKPVSFGGVNFTIYKGDHRGKNPGYQDLALMIETERPTLIKNEAVWYAATFISANENGLFPKPEFQGDEMFLEGMALAYRTIEDYERKMRGPR